MSEEETVGAPEKPKGRTLGILSIIFGAVSLIIFGIPLGLAAIVCGAVAIAREEKLGIVGIILGVIGAALAFWLLTLMF